MKILVVDDSSTMRAFLASLLAGLADAILEAENGALGLEKVRAGGIDLVVTDWNMPVMGGLDLIKAVRAEGRTVPILMVTSQGAEVDVALARAAGADDCVAKPFTPEDVQAKAKKLLKLT